jgi:enediyne biosynthesis protein E4
VITYLQAFTEPRPARERTRRDLFPQPARLLLFIGLAAGSAAEPAPAALPRFEDTSETAGLNSFFNRQGTLKKDYILESIGGGCAFLDYDSDGWLDILLVRGTDIDKYLAGGEPVAALYRNNGDGTFADVSEAAGLAGSRGWGMGVSVADYDRDGHPDFLVTGYGRNFLFRNNGDGSFSERAASAGLLSERLWSTGAVFFDYDRDGYLDVYVSRYVKFDVRKPVLRSAQCKFKGLGVFCGPQGFESEPHSLYRNNGDGTWRDVTREAGLNDTGGSAHGLGVTSFDFNNDGWSDLYVGNDSTPNLLWRNLSNGKFRNMAPETGTAFSIDGMEQASMGVETADLFNRGLLDVYVTNFSGETYELYRNNAPSGFEDITWKAGLGSPTLPLLGWGTNMLDLDLDGWLDIVAVNGHVYPEADSPETGTSYRQRLLAFRNSRDGKFEDTSNRLGPAFQKLYAGRGSAVGDYDNDGDSDILINNIDGPPSLLRNLGKPAQNWIAVRLQGPMTLGARIYVRTGKLTQMRETTSQSGYLSTSSDRAHFGLPVDGPVDEIRVVWPGGRSQTLESVETRRVVTINEPAR